MELKEFDKAADDHNIFDNYDTFSIIDRQDGELYNGTHKSIYSQPD